jgi:hypothetical protein
MKQQRALNFATPVANFATPMIGLAQKKYFIVNIGNVIMIHCDLLGLDIKEIMYELG